jgi:hypothetical protein
MTAITLNTVPRTASRACHTPERRDARTIHAARAASHVYIPSDERIVTGLVELARAAKSHGIIVAGSNCSEVFLELHQLGYLRVATTKTCAFRASSTTSPCLLGGSIRSRLSQRPLIGLYTF